MNSTSGKKIVIVGAGPAGMFAAQELADGNHDVTVVEKAHRVGGAGLRVDGKFNFHSKVGMFEDLSLSRLLSTDGEHVNSSSEDAARKVIQDIKKTFQGLGPMDMYFNKKRLEELETLAAHSGIDFMKIEQGHIGSDKLPGIMNKFKNNLESKGVKFALDTEVKDLKVTNGIAKEVVTSNGNLECDYAILCPGRAGSDWLFDFGKRNGMVFKYNPLDVGVRVEVLNSIMSDIMGYYKCHDPKFIINTHLHDDRVRTFCVCYGGYITQELYGKDFYGRDLYGVNGHSLSKTAKQSNNTNFAFLVTLGLTEPQQDTGEYGKDISLLANCLSGNKVIIQRVKDLRRGSRSDWDRIDKSYVKPTLRNAVPGDISMALPGRVMDDITEGLKKLDDVIGGVYTGSTLLYAPEIKFYARRVETQGHLQTLIENLYVAGDGAGVSRGIVSAGATGIVAAKGIKSLS